MTRKHTRTVLSLSALALAITGAALYAGPLNPPGGPITSTGKSLPEIFEAITTVEPRIAIMAANTPGDADSLYKITQPGSYYLPFSITGVVGKHGIEIVASGVTLDLNGFDLVGVAGMGAFDGVSVTEGGLVNIAVVNGSIRSWGAEGVDLGSLGAKNSQVEGVRASGNAGRGITSGSGSAVTDCVAYLNTSGGFSVGAGCTLTGCVAYQNIGTGSGFSVAGDSTVSGCTSYQNSGSGFSVGSGCTVTGCTAHANTLDGIVCVGACTISGNTCSQNGGGGGDGAGIHVMGGSNRIEGNNCWGADRGIDVDFAGNIIVKNTCSNNTINWDVAFANVCLVVQGIYGAAILGNTGGAAPGSTDPNANFTF